MFLMVSLDQRERVARSFYGTQVGFIKREKEVDHLLIWHLGKEKSEINIYMMSTFEIN